MLQLIATSTTGLESVVSKELKQLGYSPKNSDVSSGQTYFKGEWKDVVKANLWLRSAGKILVKLTEFDVRDDFDVIFDAIRSIPWEDLAPEDAAFLVQARSVKSTITSLPALQRTVKKAIVTRLCQKWNKRILEETGPLYEVELSILKDHATLTLNTTGRGLHRRGYRTFNAIAPLRETLAAALIELSVWTPSRPFLDPFCGSGTIPIEAALIARNIAPGLKRSFDFQKWPIVSNDLWVQSQEEARDLMLPPLKEKIYASDIDADMINLSQKHASAAGVENDVFFFQRDFKALEDSREYGCLICNPPYGDRLGEVAQLQELYESIPVVLSRLPTWSHFIITSWLDFSKLIGQEPTRRRKIYNGRIECAYYQFLGPRPPKNNLVSPNDPVMTSSSLNETRQETSSSDVVQDQRLEERNNPVSKGESTVKAVFSPLDDYASYQCAEFAKCLQNRVRRLRRYPKRGITCYRLYDKDLPEVPLAIDIFEGKWLHIAEYERPDNRTFGQHRLWLNKMVEQAAQVVGVSPENVFLKRRVRHKGETQYEKITETGRIIRAHEGGLTFLCNMTDYLDVGLFLDHRLTREMIRKEAYGKRFLNLFCYTGSFTCYAASGNASSTVSVDLSPSYLDWCEANLRENGFLDRSSASKHQFVKSDVIRFLKAIPVSQDYDSANLATQGAPFKTSTKGESHTLPLRGKESFSRTKNLPPNASSFLPPTSPFGIDHSDFELCVCDPPTFSNSKSTVTDWDVQRRHVELLRLLSTRMVRGGIVYFSNNYRKFKLDEEELSDLYELREISNRTVPEEFRNKRIHRCWRLVVK